ncbi:MAG TPA: ADOP family duplicated permease, partial [Vicinamibacterales bacterium]|nr:ADOP family duplicated permease [Vicinamibacterales bacterium]
DELTQHAESTYEALRADGLSADEANTRIDALIAGWRKDPASLNRVVTRSPVVAPPPPATSIWSGAMADAFYGLRMLRAQPGAALLTVLTIALGVGAVTMLFSVANGVLLSPLPWANTDRLVRVMETRGGKEGRIAGTILNGTYLAWAEAPTTIESIGAYRDMTMTMTGAGDATRLPVAPVTPSMLSMLNVQPRLGRIFSTEEGQRGNTSFVILSSGLWEQRFGARDDVLGQPLTLDGAMFTIVGVMPREFRFPSAEVQAWIPWYVQPVDGPNGTKSGTIMRALARLKPGVTPAQAAAEGTARAVAAPDAGPVGLALFGAREPIHVSVRDAKEAATAEVRPAILLLLVAAALLFATAIANVANMQLARATVRHRELTIRAALGAGTSRLARQLLIENAIVGVIGGVAGLLLTITLHSALPSLLPAGFPRADAIAVDARVLALTFVLSAITAVACGVLPLLHARRLEIARSLGDGSAASTGAGRGRVATVRALIVASQVAVTCVLVIGGVLLARSFDAQIAADRGYEPSNLLTATIPFPGTYTVQKKEQLLDQVLARIRQRPGISHAAVSTGLPLASSGGFSVFSFPSPLRGGAKVEVETFRRVITPDYFDALGIRLRAGRKINDADTMNAPMAVVVNRTFVQKYLEDIPIERAVGISLGSSAVRAGTGKVEGFIVGVVDDMKQDRPDDPPQAEMYVSFAQLPGVNHGGQAFLVARTVDDPAAYVEALRTALREEDPALALEGVMTMDQRVGNSLSRPRMYAVLFIGFAAFALIIAGAGLFGVLSYSVHQRSRELAVRTALGASRGAVIGVAVRQVTIAMMAGLAIGLAAAAALSNNLAPFIYGVSTRDWLSFGVAPLALSLMALVACVVPARRVAQTDPVKVLREI